MKQIWLIHFLVLGDGQIPRNQVELFRDVYFSNGESGWEPTSLCLLMSVSVPVSVCVSVFVFVSVCLVVCLFVW